jgi:pSer/pThr/pTyr-binding forkhead associated (FHA) protein
MDIALNLDNMDGSGSDLLLKDVKTGTLFRIPREEIDGTIIGRSSAKTDFIPTIDLASINGDKQGVSRQHVRLNLRDEHIYVTDLNSSNGTFLNGQKLVTEQGRVIRRDDELRLGHLTLRVSFG